MGEDSAKEHDAEITRVVKLLRKASSLLFITGAGVSSDSGLPTYRGIGGLYNSGTTEDGIPIEEILSGYMLQLRPELTWKYLLQIGRACQAATFNRAHEVIANLEQRVERAWTVTQNIDGFHRAAGTQNLIELHGSMRDLICTKCDYRDRIEGEPMEVPPLCPCCRAVLRPDVVLFGELLARKKMELFQREVESGFDLVFSVGTTSVFAYVAWPIEHAKQTETPTVEINPDSSEVSHLVDIRLPMRAAPALEEIWRRYSQEMTRDSTTE